MCHNFCHDNWALIEELFINKLNQFIELSISLGFLVTGFFERAPADSEPIETSDGLVVCVREKLSARECVPFGDLPQSVVGTGFVGEASVHSCVG